LGGKIEFLWGILPRVHVTKADEGRALMRAQGKGRGFGFWDRRTHEGGERGEGIGQKRKEQKVVCRTEKGWKEERRKGTVKTRDTRGEKGGIGEKIRGFWVKGPESWGGKSQRGLGREKKIQTGDVGKREKKVRATDRSRGGWKKK